MAWGAWAWGAAAGLGLLLTACQSKLPDPESCLANVEANALNQALERCNQVVAAHPRDPRPLNDRFLLHTLMQNKTAACADITKSANLLKRQKGEILDELNDEVQVRLDSCR
jgi:regulator of sirC expression with transglutaminase-like and TPR domain